VCFVHAQDEPKPVSFTEIDSVSKKRPFGVTLFLWMVLSLSAWGLLRLLAALRWWGVLNQYHSRLNPLYLSIMGAGWAVAAIVLLWSIWARKRWAYPAIPISIVLWLAEYWLERNFFESPRANLPFAIAISVLLLVVTLFSTFNRKTKNFLLKSEEHEQPEEHSISE